MISLIGLLFNFIGSLLVSISVGQIGKNDEDGGYTTLENGKSYNLAYLTHPNAFKLGLSLFVIGFVFQLISGLIDLKVLSQITLPVIILPSINISNEVAYTILGAVLGIIFSEIITWIKRPRIKFIKFDKSSFNDGGKLLRINFSVKGKSSPGISTILIKSPRSQYNAKWDETPNPLSGDKFDQFEPNLVPQTYYQPLLNNQEYNVPFIHLKDGQMTLFCGWWYGKDYGYAYNLEVLESDEIILELLGQNVNWKMKVRVKDLLELLELAE